ncbi:hypothetical protein EMWEY_00053300 [Eimeria maxima]|uniref:Uncharacterized protein n=1 Tax=Eimeria maxima TaxID=5804 RepID=U6M6W0_EIMMA|nr:hypothetical protein EMWEY_00053300 [Eimeria maxima]CDJ58798.1 hypothetical protein EMWEY_00053300 [Eimeria maxima]
MSSTEDMARDLAARTAHPPDPLYAQMPDPSDSPVGWDSSSRSESANGCLLGRRLHPQVAKRHHELQHARQVAVEELHKIFGHVPAGAMELKCDCGVYVGGNGNAVLEAGEKIFSASTCVNLLEEQPLMLKHQKVTDRGPSFLAALCAHVDCSQQLGDPKIHPEALGQLDERLVEKVVLSGALGGSVKKTRFLGGLAGEGAAEPGWNAMAAPLHQLFGRAVAQQEVGGWNWAQE